MNKESIFKLFKRKDTKKMKNTAPSQTKETENTPTHTNTQDTMKHTNDGTPSQTVNTQENNTQMNKSEIHNLIIVDESGSMSHLREATLSGINETLATIREAQKQFGNTQTHYVTLVTFDSPGKDCQSVRTIIDCMHIDLVKDFTDYQPCGCTPLYDAMGISLKKLEARVDKNPFATAIVTIMTDGLENASCEWNAQRLRILIEGLKEKGWTFSYMGSAHNVKSVTDLLCIDNVVEFRHDQESTANTWRRDRSAKMHMYESMNSSVFCSMDLKQRVKQRKQMSLNYYSNRVTPSRLIELPPHSVVVFSSDNSGNLSTKTRMAAKKYFGAKDGQREGLQGHSYAIPVSGCSLSQIVNGIERFAEFAKQNPDMKLYVTELGLEEGFTVKQIAPLFTSCISLENVALPKTFWDELGLNMI